MNYFLSTIFTIVMVTLPAALANLIEQLNFYAQQNQYTSQVFQAPFSLENVMGPSLELAVQSCQESFKWQRWNCPSTDFFRRRTLSKTQLLDREDVYVAAITTAATLYSIAKNCSSGVVADCGCSNESPLQACSDDPIKAEELYNKHVGNSFTHDFAGMIRKHNHKVITNLLRKSLVQQCTCQIMSPAGCLETVCWQTLRSFEEIAKDIRQIYDESIQLEDAGINTRIMWKNIPLDVFVHMKDSPNYCEPEAVPAWNGMRGRQCSFDQSTITSTEESESCRQLCHECGYRVSTQNVITERHCNCQFSWSFQVHCDLCVNVEQQHYCY